MTIRAPEVSIDLGNVIDRIVGKVEDQGRREAFGQRAFWSQINDPTTVHEHDEEHGRT